MTSGWCHMTPSQDLPYWDLVIYDYGKGFYAKKKVFLQTHCAVCSVTAASNEPEPRLGRADPPPGLF